MLQKRETKKETNHQRTERYDIKGVVTKVKRQVCYFKII